MYGLQASHERVYPIVREGSGSSMPSYGYTIFRVFIHKYGEKSDPLRLGTLAPPNSAHSSQRSALEVVYGALRGLQNHRLTDSSEEKHLQITHVEGVGQCVKFSMSVGRSGEESQIVDPQQDHQPVFQRARHHIDTTLRRGLFVVPDHSTYGLLVVEAHGRSTGRELLTEELKRMIRDYTDGLISEFPPLADPVGLARYLEQADIRRIVLKRTGVPGDIANGLEMEKEEADLGRLQLQIKPAGRGSFRRHILKKLQDPTPEARRQLLTVDGLVFDELNVQVQAEGRRMTLSVTGQQAPSFIYLVEPQNERPTDIEFYRQVMEAVPDLARGASVSIGDRWANENWSEDGRAFIIGRPAQEDQDEPAPEGP